MRLRACLLAIAVLVPVRAFAQTPPPAAPPPPVEAAPPPAAPAPTVVVTTSAPATVVVVPPAVPAAPAAAPAVPLPKFTWGGLIDTYYMFNFIRADGANTLTPPNGRAFDTNANSITLALAKLSLNAAIDPVSFQLDLGYGTTGTVINGANTGDALSMSVGAAAGTTNLPPAFLIEQAFGEISLPGNLTLDFGKFTTTAGAEVIEANKNWLYSRSFLFNAIPLLHTGVRANLKINDQVTLQASLVNGWNNDPDNNAWKTGGVSGTFTINPMVTVIATTYFGKEGTQGAMATTPGAFRFLGDLVAAFTVNDKFGLNLNFDYISNQDDISGDHLVGAALMGRYVVSDHAYVSLRGEFVNAKATSAVSGISATNTIGEGTLMVGVPVGKNFELRPELRADFAGNPIYSNGKKDQFTGTLAALTFF